MTAPDFPALVAAARDRMDQAERAAELDDLAYDFEDDDSVPCWNCGGEGETDCNPIECCDAHPCHICNGRGWLV